MNTGWPSDTPQGMLDPNFTTALLNPNESFTVTFTVTVDPNATGTSKFEDSQAEVTEEMAFTDLGGNWIMQMHIVQSLDHFRIEFVELVGQGDSVGAYGDIIGHLSGVQQPHSDAGLEAWSQRGERLSLGKIFRGIPSESVEQVHRENRNPLGIG